jgi:hypothetical protein
MSSISKPDQARLDEAFLRRSFDVARQAMTHGNHPFGAILVDTKNSVLIETENGYMPAHDGTAHAERLLATQACRTLDTNVLRAATLYSSAEPCALRAVTGDHPENPTLDLPCREVFKSGQRPTEVIGPLLEDEAEALHAGVWNR